MNLFKRYNLTRILITASWILLSCGAIVLLAAAIKTRDKKLCKGLEVTIHGVRNHFFLDKTDVRKIITSYVSDELVGIEAASFNLVGMEADLKKEVWVKDADLYFDNNHVLQAFVEEREPIARIFTAGGNSFYIDESRMMLPLSDKISARLPVFTNFPSDTKVLSKKDSSLLNDVKKLSVHIQSDSFLMAMIEQVEITPNRGFEMIPKIGDQLIVFGDASDMEKKFEKLKIFYKKVMMKYGWSRYSVINLQYKGQVVGKLKGKDDVSEDSLRTVQIMHAIAVNAARAASDSLQTILQDNEKNTTDVSIIQQSMEREDEGADGTGFPIYPVVDEPSIPAEKPKEKVDNASGAAAKKTVTVLKPAPKKLVKPPPPATAKKPVVKKPVAKPTQVAKPQPKVTMPKKNDY